MIPSHLKIQSSLIKKAEDTEADTAEQSAIKLRAQQQMSNALAVTDQPTANGYSSEPQLGPVKVPSMSNEVTYKSTVNFVLTNMFLENLYVPYINRYFYRFITLQAKC